MASTKQQFSGDAALTTAKGYHAAARQLDEHRQVSLAHVPKGASVNLDVINQRIGQAAGAVVLEALALELILKVRLDRAGLTVWPTHNHSDLFRKLPDPEKMNAEHHYALRRHPAMRSTLEEALKRSCDLFVKWRYMHEHPQVEASLGEMQRAFEALVEGL